MLGISRNCWVLLEIVKIVRNLW